MATYGIGTAGNSLEFDTQNANYPVVIFIDTGYFLGVWGGGASNYGTAQVFNINTTKIDKALAIVD